MAKAKTIDAPVQRKFGAKDKIGYMFGDFGCNMSFQLITSYLMLFVTQGLGLSTALWAVLIIVAKIFDAINDPIIGALVDARKPGKHGKYKPWIFWGAFAIAGSTALLFLDVSMFSVAGKFAYCLIMYMVWSVAYTAANVPYGSLNAALTDKPGERSSLSALRNIGAGLAMVPVLFLVPMIGLNEHKQVITENFFWLALVFGCIGIAGFMATIFMCKERRVAAEQPKGKKFSYWRTLKNFFKNRAVVALSLASIAQIVFIQSYSITLTIAFQYYFVEADKFLMSIANILAMAGMMVFIPFMSKMSVKWGKKEITSWPNLVGIGVLVLMLFIPFPQTTAGGIMFLALFMVAMMGAGTFFLATWSMVADCVDEQEVKTGEREEASVYATYSLSRKIAQGIGGALSGLALGWVGYTTFDQMAALKGFAGDQLKDPTIQEEIHGLVESANLEAGSGILKMTILLPLIGFILCFVILLLMYNLNKKRVESNTIYLRNLSGDEGAVADTQPLFYTEEELQAKEQARLAAIEAEKLAKREARKNKNK